MQGVAIFPDQGLLCQRGRRDVDGETVVAGIHNQYGKMLPRHHGYVVEKAGIAGGDKIAGGVPLVVKTIGVWFVAMDGLRQYRAR